MFGSKLLKESRFHITVIRSLLSRQLPVVFPEISEEISQAFQQYIPVTDGGAFDGRASHLILCLQSGPKYLPLAPWSG